MKTAISALVNAVHVILSDMNCGCFDQTEIGGGKHTCERCEALARLEDLEE